MKPEFADAYAELEKKHWWFRARRQILLDLIRKSFDHRAESRKLRIADIGCGPGANPAAFEELGEVTGIDASPLSVEAAKAYPGIKVLPGRAEKTGLDDNAFDLVLCLDVLEHLKDDMACLAECRRITASNGLLVITAPAVRGIWSRQDIVAGHLRRYEKQQLIRACRRAGFHTEFCSYFNTLLLPPAFLMRTFMPGRGVCGSDFILRPGFINNLCERIFALERKLLPHLALPFGLSLIAVLRKEQTTGKTLAQRRRY